MVDALEVGDVLELERVGNVHLLTDVLVHHVDVRLVHSFILFFRSLICGGGGWVGEQAGWCIETNLQQPVQFVSVFPAAAQ